ncbi:hypothetical protein B0E53_06833 [Micromonospora sp. MH33]|uniref:hypothetical protein n=1 Tax=Micromonospora sp. MH33 TaxID=1945509 RepID=UPI000D29879D|nr:hypothetical protein [Micromonospora sp. MH33]PSK61272.1 hypothetical protein B0E53_06833 [Micromonospora sp. MH33]
MLSFTAVHALAGCLLATDVDAEHLGWGQPPTLLLIHTRPLHTASPAHALRSVEFPLCREDLLTDPAGLPDLLHRLAAGLRPPEVATPCRATLDTIVRLIRATEPDAGLLAWATCYDDILTIGDAPRQARRIDAVDTDGRLYQLSHPRGDDQPLLLIDDTPDPGDIPATYPGLTALITATTQKASSSGRAAHGRTGPMRRPDGTDEEPIFITWGPGGTSLRCQVCGAVDEVVQDEMPSMAGYGDDTYIRCSRCGSVETSDPIFGWRAKPAPWPAPPQQDEP